MEKSLELEIRAAVESDTPLLLSFIQAMATFEKLEAPVTEKELRESLFGSRSVAFPLLAFVDEKPAAYAVYFFSFSTMIGKRGLWLDDIFVDPRYRGQGIGKAIMAHLARIAQENKCGRFEWMVLDWNKPAISMYEKLSATIFENWQLCRLDGQGLAKLAKQKQSAQSTAATKSKRNGS